jgi:DNA-binding beta-propeller fold protein YncE
LVAAIVLIVVTALGPDHDGSASSPSVVSSIKTAAVSGTAESIVMTPDGHYAYVLSGDKYVYVLNLDSTRLVARTLLGETGEGLALSRDGKRLYVVANDEKSCGNGGTTSDNGTLFALSTATNHIIGKTNFASSMESGIAVSPDGQSVFVEGDGLVDVVNTMTYRTDSTIRITRNNSGLETIAVSPDGKNLYGATSLGGGSHNSESSFYVIDLTTHVITATLSSEQQLLTDIVPNPRIPVVYVTHLGGTKGILTLEALNSNGQPEHSLNVGDGSSGIAVTANGATAYLATQESGVVVLNTASLSEIATIPSSSFGFYTPGPVAVSSSGRRLCVLEGRDLGLFGSNKVWIVNLRSSSR